MFRFGLSSMLALLLATASVPVPVLGPPAPPAAFSKKKRHARPREVVPEEVLALLPWKGIYASGSGLSWPAWRIVVTVEGDLRAGSNARPGSSPTALVDKKRMKLPPAVLADLVALADRAWRDKAGRPQPPSPDYGEILVLADGPEVFLLDPQGPIPAGAAAQLLARLKAAAAP